MQDAELRGHDDLNGDGIVDESELSKSSERATTSMDQVREWELGGWKSGATRVPTMRR